MLLLLNEHFVEYLLLNTTALLLNKTMLVRRICGRPSAKGKLFYRLIYNVINGAAGKSLVSQQPGYLYGQ
jgi:hypothetical protein